MNARRRPRMRRLVDNTVALVRSGELPPELAAQKLMENGVPLAVIGRVLGPARADTRSAEQPPSVANATAATTTSHAALPALFAPA